MLAAQFHDLCEAHDFQYHMGSLRRLNTGELSMARIRAALAERPDLRPIYDAWAEHRFSGPAYGRPRAPKPERPKLDTFPGKAPAVHEDQLTL